MLRAAPVRGLAALLAALGLACSDAHGNQPAQGPVVDASTVRDAGRDAAQRVKERFVTIELFPVAHREIRVGDDGEPVYGEITPIEGAEVCVKYGREAFALFEPFVELDEPLCVTSEAGKVVHIEGVPAQSDLVITTVKDGYMPGSATFRTDDNDVVVPAWGGNVFTTLARAGEWDPWIEPVPAAMEEAGLVAVESAMVWLGPAGGEGVLGAEASQFPWGSLPGVYWGAGANVRVEPQGAGAFELQTPPRRPRLLWLPKGSYRITFDHPGTPPCQPTGVEARWPTLGLPVDAREALELPVLPGHQNWAHANCPCAPTEAPDQKLLDIATCTFESADAGI